MNPKNAPPPLPIILDSEIPASSPALKGFESSSTPDKGAHEEILHRAYSIWESAGRPENCEVAHWLEAEAEVMAEA